MKQIYIKWDFSNATNSNTFIRNEHFDMHKTDFARLCLWAFYYIVYTVGHMQQGPMLRISLNKINIGKFIQNLH